MDLTYYRNEIMKQAQAIKDHMDLLMEPLAKEEGLTLLQLFVLVSIQCPHMQTIGSLSKELRVGQANTSTLCKKMERDGYLIRERSLHDERIVQLSLSEKGKDIMQRIKRKMDVMDESLQDIPEEKFKIVLKGFQEAEQIFNYMLQKQQEEKG